MWKSQVVGIFFIPENLEVSFASSLESICNQLFYDKISLLHSFCCFLLFL